MAKSIRNPVNLYLFLVANVFLLTSVVNVRYRFDKELDPHIGGADFAAPLFLFVAICSIPMLPRVVFHLRYLTRKNTLVLFALLFLAPTIVGVTNAPFPNYSYIEILRQVVVLTMMCFFIVMIQHLSIKWIYYSLGLVTLGQAFAVILQISGIQIPFASTEGAHFLNESVTRFAGLQGHPNILSGLMSIVAVFMLAGLFYESILPRKFFMWFYFLSSVLVLLSLSRAGLAVLVTSSLFLITVGRGKNLLRKKYLALTGLFALGLVFFFFFGESFQHRIFDGVSSNVTSRLTINTVAWEAFLDNPLIGAGSNNFIYFAQDYDATTLTRFWKAPVHNLYLLYLSESGAVGFTFFLVMLLLLFSGFRKYRRLNNQKGMLLSAGAEAAMVGILVGSLFGYFYKQDVAQPLLALIFAIGLCRFRTSKKGG